MQQISIDNQLIKYSNYVNEIWHTYINNISKNSHVFLKDMNYVQDMIKMYANTVIINDNVKNNIKFNECFDETPCNYVPNTILTNEKINEIYDDLTKQKTINWNLLRNKLDEMSNYLLFSNIIFDEYKKVLREKKSNTINVLILGSGPTGLYLANYINNINLLAPRINLLVIDNRSVDGNRLPFSRNRIFGINFDMFSSFYSKFPCINELVAQGGIEIKYLENILIILAYKYNIPFYFTNKIKNERILKKFISKNKIDVIFDCTGGRFKNDFITKIPNNFFNSEKILENDKFNVVKHQNEYQLQWKNNINGKFFLSMEIYDDNDKYISTELWTYNIIYAEDVKLFYKIHNKCFKIKPKKITEAIKYFNNIKDLNLSLAIQNVLINNANNKIKFYVIETNMYHKISISEVIKQSHQSTIYIGCGDTIFSSHFVVGAGLSRLLTFINYVVWYMQTLN
ncbi:putative ORFan, which is homologous to Tupanvirus deep ocean [Cotonvirus japonicus]|uniref:ORFan, which is homologous to Tupanvirus deep ocean n=1 Tax=Cotonvirus japonicus TaxID=2811091 RepID=A0ABM7NU25_9VIRU|nr:putative ORFan, which is homologous to Tupanvirus deep ocean [Cotonvirus japonicus]BCS83684.1 putative ORFan, which is homologous to Tupanvirus deep ocean [Cotonvirus japonicus]